MGQRAPEPTVHAGDRAAGPASVVIGAGGTGGHIYPGLALAAAIRRREPDARIAFTGTRRGLEARLVPEAGYRLHTVDMIPFARSLGSRRFLLPADLVRAAHQCRRILREEAADVAVGMGGYSSAPLVAGARLASVPSLIHESNAVPGRANLFSALLTRNVALAFDAAAGHFRVRGERQTVGMPLMPHLEDFDRAALRVEARARYSAADGTFLLMVNGGSQGSVVLNEAAADLAGRWRDRRDVRIVIKAGADGRDALARRLAENGGAAVAEAVAYIDRIDFAYAAADLLVCRAGSATVAELAQVGLPAVFVPYPHAPHDHQTHNAAALVAAGAARLLPQGQLSGESLAEVVGELAADPAALAAMSEAAGGAARRHAADRLAGWVLDLAHQSKGRQHT